MNIEFHKYHGTGNDFVLIDNRDLSFPKNNSSFIKKMCHRRFGIGADGLILLQNNKGFDFEMVYFNADGKPGSMCGNGGRCTVAFAHSLGLIKNKTKFIAVDGIHEAVIQKEIISLKMANVKGIEKIGNSFFVNTGSPHYVKFADDVEKIDIVKEGKKIRYNARFQKEGTNVNFVELKSNTLHIRTYERGVEDETLSCGTGVTASALVAAFVSSNLKTKQFLISTPGGKLKVSFSQKSPIEFTDVWLHGPAIAVYKGVYNL